MGESEGRRVVVTGIGVKSPLGNDTQTTWAGAQSGRSGIVTIELEHTQVGFAGVVPDFDPKTELAAYVKPIELKRRLSRPPLLSLATAVMALADAGLLEDGHLTGSVDPRRIGIRTGTGIGGAPLIAPYSDQVRAGERLANSVLGVEPERVASVPAMKLDLQGSAAMVSAACAGGSVAIIDAAKEIKLGHADYMLAGGAEAPIDYMTLEMFRHAGAHLNVPRLLEHEREEERALGERFHNNPKQASRPFDDLARGFVMGEGAAHLVLEEFEHAKRRGAHIYAELTGYGYSSGSGSDTAPNQELIQRALRMALDMSGTLPQEGTIYVNAHAASTQEGDPHEAEAIRAVLGQREGQLAISSMKAMLGHTIGAAGAIETAIALLAMKHGIVPPSVNLQDPIQETQGLNMVPGEAQSHNVTAVVKNAFGFGNFNYVTVYQPV